MTDTTIASTTGAEPWALRKAMTDKLVADGWVTSPVHGSAFRAVPRELFSSGFPLETVYETHEVLRFKRAADGTVLSSLSVPWLQARMIAQAGVQAGMRVLEIGSGGYNAGLLARIAGPSGHVVTVDIDPEVTARTAAALDAAGYGNGRVTIVTADADGHIPGDVPYDAIIVTAGAWDIPPGWLSSVADGGTLVVPLRMNGVTRSAGFCRVTNDDEDGGEARGTGLRAGGLGRYACSCASRDSLAWLDTRKTGDDGAEEFGVRAVGSGAGPLAKVMLAEIRPWDRHGRNLPGDAITYWPALTYREPVPGKTAVYRKASGTTTVTWPAAPEAHDSNSSLN